MEALMGSSLKFISSKDEHLASPSLRVRDAFFFKSPLHHSRNNIKLSLSFSTSMRLRPISHTQAEVENQELKLEESLKEGAEPQTIRVTLQLQRECSFGQNFMIVGDDPMLGLWDPNNAIPLIWSDGHVWTVDVDIPKGKCIKFKFIMQESDGQFMWQPGPDRVLEFWGTHKTIVLCQDWENPDSRSIIEAHPTLNEVEVNKSNTQEAIEPKGNAINLNQALELEEGVPVLVPGLTSLPETDTDQQGPVEEAPKDEAESVNGSAQDLHLPELDLKGNQSSKVSSSMDENQDSCEREDPMESLLDNDIQWCKNVFQKLLNGLGIR